MRRLRLFAAALVALACAGAGLAALTAAKRERLAPQRASAARLAGDLGLTDLAIWTEARYTRHPALADRFSPFQDHPGALEHFPAGSVLPPPPHLGRPGSRR